MLRYALIYGGIAGAIVIGIITGGIAMSGQSGAEHSGSQLVGYLIMLLALSIIFFGVKQYRDKEKGGVIRFLPAFGCGLAISAVAGVIYVAGWEAYLAATGHQFIHEYTANIIAKKAEAGLAGAELEALKADMASMVRNYSNALYRLPMTFLEIFPVGALIALISAALLRNPKLLPARAA